MMGLSRTDVFVLLSLAISPPVTAFTVDGCPQRSAKAFVKDITRGNCVVVSMRQRTKCSSIRAAICSSESISADVNNAPRKVPVGGDFAGITANFDVRTGQLIPIPEHLVPKSLLEWGQAPSTLEILVSEDNDDTRYTTTILPETGCGVDNLETTKSVEKIGKGKMFFNDTIWSSHQCSSREQRSLRRLETYFGLSFSEDQQSKYRSRLTLNLLVHDNADLELLNPVRVSLERQINSISSNGTVANGGGLDGQSVSRWLGPVLTSRQVQNFAEEKMCSEWVPLSKCNEEAIVSHSDSSMPIPDSLMLDAQRCSDVVMLYLPGNMTLAYSYGPERCKMQLEMGQIYNGRERQVLRRNLSGKESADFVETWIEQGEYVVASY